MLQRIESIENAAVWSGYDANTSGTPDFKRYNLIYGWNASGKTTLSRVVALFGDNGVSRLPSDARVRISDGAKVLDSAKAEDRRLLPVRIFNRDFIDDNLQKTDYTQAPALFMVGQENIRLANRIESLNRRRERVVVMHKAIETEQGNARSILDKLATELARECGSLLGMRDFRSPNVKTLAQDLLSPAEQLLDDSGFQTAVSQARDQSEFVPFRDFPELTVPAPLDINEITELLRKTPQQNAIER
ncbi:MAG: AAA family ATPase, partial [Burkholderiaceae bacterium]|nr:AAA family ATPase [Burkholderiaceae bacterium]